MTSTMDTERDDQLYGRWTLLAALLLLGGLIAAFIQCFPAEVTKRIDPSRISLSDGRAYAITQTNLGMSTPSWLACCDASDSQAHPAASQITLREDGIVLGPPHTLHENIARDGAGRFSHWNGDLIFSSSDNTDPRYNGRKYTVSYVEGPAWWVPWLLTLCGYLLLPHTKQVPAHRNRLKAVNAALFWSGFAAIAAYLHVTVAALLPAPVVSPDSSTYLTWSVFRTWGYPIFLHAQHFVLHSWEYVPIVQIDLLIGGLALLCHAVILVSRRYFAGWLLVSFALAAPTMLLSAGDLLTEAPFAALVMAHAAFVLRTLVRPTRVDALLAGLTLGGAVAVKSIGVALIAPAILLALVVDPRVRRLVAMLIVAPAVLAWAIPSSYNAWRYGAFESSHAGGYALAGHVAWAVRAGGDPSPDDTIVATSIASVLAKRPRVFHSIVEYVEYTANEYNELLWAHIFPAMQERYPVGPPGDPCNWRERPGARCKHNAMIINKALMGVARRAIVGDPGAYMKHVLAHCYGMWRDTFVSPGDFVLGMNHAAESLFSAYDPARGSYAEMLAPLPRFRTLAERWPTVDRFFESPLRRALDLSTARPGMQGILEAFYRFPAIVWGTSICACVLLFRFRRLDSPAQALCYMSLCLNAYFLATALAQPALVRYASVMQGLAGASVALACMAAVSAVQRTAMAIGRRSR
jgi:hypothetical protein